MGTTRCKVCTHPHHDKIAAAILQGETLEAMSERFKVSVSSLSRHKTYHLGRAVNYAKRKPAKRRRKKVQHDPAKPFDANAEALQVYRDLEEQRQAAIADGATKIAADLAATQARFLEFVQKNSGQFGRADEQKTSAQSEAVTALQAWSLSNLNALTSGYACDNCGARTWVNIGDEPPALWLQNEPPKVPGDMDEERWLTMTDARQTVLHGKPYWLIPAFRPYER